MLETCSSCSGFLPPGVDACPNCDARAPRSVVERAASAVGLGMMAVTLMACYAAYDVAPGPCDGSPISITLGSEASLECIGDSDGSVAACGGQGTPDRAVDYQPDATVAGRPGTFTLTWTSSYPVGVHASDDLGNELGCGAISVDGTLSFHVDAAAPMTFFVERASDDGWVSVMLGFQPDDACGNGVLDPGEECDPGAIELGACDASCRLDLCKTVDALSLGANTGDTSTQQNQLALSCGQPSPAAVRIFTPGEPGTATITLGAGSGLSLYGVSGCPYGGAVDAACSQGSVSGPVAPDQPLYAVVAAGSLVAGPYELDVEFTPACGDGVQDAWETCDDGNRDANDGCDATCHVEPAFWCAASPALPMGDSTGDTTGGPRVFPTCTGSAAPQRFYTFTPTQNGALVASLTSAQNLALAVASSCGGSFAYCSDTKGPGEAEVVSAVLTAGQTYFVIVDGSSTADAGPFSLTTTFVPTP